MPHKDNEIGPMSAQGSTDNTSGGTGVIKLPEPTADQRDYLERIRRSGEEYDKTAVVGGPPRTTG